MKSTLTVSILTVALLFPFSFVQAQTNGEDSISFKTKLESISPPAGEFLTPPSIILLMTVNKKLCVDSMIYQDHCHL